MLVVLMAGATAFAYYQLTGKMDGPMEEFMETVAEKEVENLLDMPSGTLTGTLDLSSDSKEK
jgi:hypothetical protein